MLFGPDGHALSATSIRKKNGKYFRYYVSYTAQSKGYANSPLPPLSAPTLEKLVLDNTRRRLASPELMLQVWNKVSSAHPNIEMEQVRKAMQDLSSIWEELFTPEKRRLTELLISENRSHRQRHHDLLQARWYTGGYFRANSNPLTGDFHGKHSFQW